MMPRRPSRLVPYSLIVLAAAAAASPVAASDWQYGCRGVLPTGDAPVIIFSRARLMMLPKAWVNGPLLAAVNDMLLGSSFRAVGNNSGLVAKMVFTREDHPEDKLTLTEMSSKTISDISHAPGKSPRSDRTTTYRKVYRWVSNSIYEGPYDIEMECVNWELSAPVR